MGESQVYVQRYFWAPVFPLKLSKSVDAKDIF